MFDVVITHQRVEALARACFALLPGRIYPILDVLGNDEYREVDPYIAYDAVGIERFIDAIRRHRGWFYDDGMVGFGAMSVDPFVYVYVDEHKILTLRVQVDLRERVEKILQAFDLQPVEEPLGVDSVEHEHMGVLVSSDDRPDLLYMDEIVDELRESWRLELNIDPDENVDDDGKPLGVTGWRCLIGRRRDGSDAEDTVVVLLAAPSLTDAEHLAADAAASEDADNIDEIRIIEAHRVSPERFAEMLGGAPEGMLSAARVWAVERVAEDAGEA